MLRLRYDAETLSGLHADPLGAAFFLTQEGKDALYDLVPVFRPDDHGRPSMHAILFSIILGLPRLDDGVPFASALVSRILKQNPGAKRDHHLRLKSWVEEINASSAGLIEIHFRPADFEDGRARTIDRINIAPELQYPLFHEPLAPGMVNLATDRVLHKYALERARVDRLASAKQLAIEHADGEQRVFLDFLHSQHVRAFVIDPEREAEARAWARGHYDASHCSGRVAGKKERQFTHAMRILRRTLLYPKPLYQSSPLTARINPFGAGLLGLPTPMRRILQPGNYILDLENAHLRIFAALFGLEKVLAALDDGTLYGQLAAAMGDEWTAETAKGVLKHNAILPMIYGSEEQQVEYRLSREHLEDDEIESFLNHPITVEIRDASNEALEKILHEGGMQGHDRFCDVTEVLQHKTKQREDGTWVGGERARRKAARSVLALVNQSYEWGITKPARDAALAGKCRIPAWQHDGCDIRPTTPGTGDKLLKALCAEIAQRGESIIGVAMSAKVETPA